MLCDEDWDGVGGTEAQEGGDRCIHIVDSHSCTVDTNRAL